MEQQNIANGGMQIVIPNLKEQQIIYLDFDGELTSYNGEILTIDNVIVQNSSLTEKRIANIVAQLNAQYSAKNVIFVTQKPENTEYSTIYIGKTNAFDSYGNFAGLAETIDEGNKIKNDNAFVMLDATTNDEEIISTITHETDHLLGTLAHGGNDLEKYASQYGVSSGVTLSGVTLNNSNDRMYVYSGGTADSTMVNSGAYMYVYSGGTATNIIWTPCIGTVIVEDGTYVTFVSNYSGTYVGSANKLLSNAQTIDSKEIYYGSIYVMESGIANNTTVNNHGYMCISSGGTANNTTITSNGFMRIFSDGIANYTTIDNYGSIHIYGGIANDITVNFSSYVSAHIGGIANNTTINSSGTLDIYDGSIANNTIVNAGGSLDIWDGGIANNTTINTSGSLHIYDGGIVNNTTIYKNSIMYVHSGGIVNNTIVNSGRYSIREYGKHQGSLLITSGSIVTCWAGSIIDFTISERNSSDDYLINNLSLISGTPTYTITVSNNQAFGTYKLAQGAENFTGLISIGNGSISYGAITVNGEDFIYNDVTYSLDNIDGNLLLNIKNNFQNILIYSSGTLTSSGKTINGVTLVSGGNDNMCISSGGIANDTSINTKGYMHISSGGTANSTTINSDGYMHISSGGTANYTTINAYGDMYVSSGGTANDTIIDSYGYMYVKSGGTANSTTVNSDGIITIGSGGTANNTTINSDGIMHIYDGGTANNIIVSAYGSMCISSGGKYEGNLWIDENANVSIYEGGIFDFNISERNVTDDYIINDLSKISGTPTYTITVSATQEYGTYKLAQGAENFNGTISIGDGTINYGSITVNGENFIYNETMYSLDNVLGNLTLTIGIKDIIPPESPIFVVSEKEMTNKDVIITATFSDDSEHKQYSINGGTWKDYTDPIVMTNNGIVSFRGIDAAGNISDVTTYEVNNIDKVAPTLNITGNPTTWTNKDVTLTANVSDGVIEFFNGKEWITGSTHTVSKNGIYTFKVTDIAGNVTTKDVEVSFIDKVAPNNPIAIANITTPTNKDVIVSATFSDDSVTKQYSLDNKTWETYTEGIKFTNIGVVYFRGIDAAGNISDITEYQVTNIDKIAPTIEVAGNPTKWTNKDVTLTANVNEGIVEFFNGKEWVTGSTHTVTDNGTYKFKVTDVAGNVTTKDVEVSFIDKIAPNKPIATANITYPTNKDVIVSATFSDDSVTRQYSLDNKTWDTYTEGIKFTNTGVVFFRGIDAAGNISNVTEYQVSNIDKVAPTLEVTGNPTAWTNKDVTLTANVSDGIVEFWNGNTWISGSTHTVSKNGTYKFRATDDVGNVTVQDVIVNKIDKNISIIEIKTDAKVLSNQNVTITANVNEEGCTIQYQIDNGSWQQYSKNVVVSENCTINFKVTDKSGNITTKSVVVDTIDNVADNKNIEYIFISSKYTGNTTGKKQNNIVLTYEKNAFSTVESALNKYTDLTNKVIVMVDSKTNINTSINLPTIAGTTVTPTIKETDNSYSYKATSQAKNSITITKETGNTEFIRFATVDVNGGDVETIIGGKLTNSKETATIVDKKGTVTTTDKFTNTTNATGKFIATNNATIENVENYSTVNLTNASVNEVTAGNTKLTTSSKIVDAYDKYQKTISCVNDKVAAGSITLTDGANANEINAFANVTLNNATAGNISNFTSKDSKSETTTFAEDKNTVTRKVTLSHTENSAGTLKATNVKTLGDVTGFATVTLLNVNDAGDFKRVDENGNKYSTVKETLAVKTNKDKTVTGTYSKTETFTRNGKLTATNSNIGDIANYSTVTLDGTTANNISNFQETKIVTKGTATWKNMDVYSRPNDYDLTLENFDLEETTTKSLNGSVTLKNNASAASITNYKTVALSDSTVDEISNVNKVTVNKGKSIITSFVGSKENDTLTIAKDAALVAKSINLGYEAKDTINLTGTLILTGTEIVASKISGKGEIVATSNIYSKLDIDYSYVLDIGETAENFKGTTYENSDDTIKKAAKWDSTGEYDGWMGSYAGYKTGSDNIDFIKFKASANDSLVISNTNDISWTLLDKKGNVITDTNIFNNGTFLASGEYILQIENNNDEKSISYSVKLA